MLSPRAYQLAGNAHVLNIGVRRVGVRRAGVRRAGHAPADGATLQQRSRGGEDCADAGCARRSVDHGGAVRASRGRHAPRTARRDAAGEPAAFGPASARLPHQLAARRLVAALGAAAPPDIEVLEAVGVAVPAGLLVPDVVVARAAAVHGAQRNLAATDVLAVVEIVSPASRTQDRR